MFSGKDTPTVHQSMPQPSMLRSFSDSISNFWLQRRTNDEDDAPAIKATAIVTSQLIALLAASTNAASYTLVNKCGITTQFFQMIPMYLLLSLQLFARERPHAGLHQKEEVRFSLRIPWWNYWVISVFFDVLPNFLVLRSLCYTALTSVTLLSALSVPSTMIFSKLLLQRTFSSQHYLGVCFCILGGCLTVLCDQEHADITTDSSSSSSLPSTSSTFQTTESMNDSSSNLLKIGGDLLVVSSALVYGLGDVVAEQAVKQMDPNEYLGMIGVFGFLHSVTASALWESQEIIQWMHMPSSQQLEASFLLLWYTTSVYGYYRTYAYFLTTADATLLNLSGQASNVWAILFSVLLYRFMPSALFFVALLLVVWGVFMYEGYYYSCLLSIGARPLTNSFAASGQEATLLLANNQDGNSVPIVECSSQESSHNAV